jgi:hypothetical protein
MVDRGHSARVQRNVDRLKERISKLRRRGYSERSNPVKILRRRINNITRRRDIKRGAPTGLPKQAVTKAVFIRKKDGREFGKRQIKTREGFVDIPTETRRAQVITRAVDGRRPTPRQYESLKEKIKQKKKLVTPITRQELIAKRAEARGERSQAKIRREISKAEQRAISRREFNLLVSKKIGVPKKVIDIQAKLLKIDPNLLAEKAFIGTKALGSELTRIADQSTAIQLIVAANAIDALKRGKGREILRNTTSQLKSQNKDSILAAKQGIKFALKEPSTYLLIPQASALKGGIALAAVKKGAAKGGKTVTRYGKTPTGKDVVVSKEKIVRFGSGKLKVLQDKTGVTVSVVPKGPAKTLKGPLGRAPTPTQRRSIVGRDRTIFSGRVSTPGKTRILTNQGTITLSRINKPVVNTINRSSKKVQKSISDQASKGLITRTVAKQQTAQVKEFAKLSNKIAKKTASGAEIRRFNRLQQEPGVKSILSNFERAPTAPGIGVRGRVTQGRERVVEAIKRKLAAKKRARTQLVGLKKKGVRSTSKVENVLTSSDAKAIPVVSSATQGKPGTIYIVESLAAKGRRLQSTARKKSIALFRDKQATRIRVQLYKKKAIQLGLSVGSILGALTSSANVSAQILTPSLKPATITDVKSGQIQSFVVDVQLSPAVVTKAKADQVVKKIPPVAIQTSIITTKAPPKKPSKKPPVTIPRRTTSKIVKEKLKLLPIPKLKLPKLSWKTKPKKGYSRIVDIIVKRAGKVRRLRTKLTENRAYLLGKKYVDNKTIRSFELQLVGFAKVKDIKKPSLKKFRDKISKDPSVLTLVEKSRYAIDTPGEKRELRISRKRKKNL